MCVCQCVRACVRACVCVSACAVFMCSIRVQHTKSVGSSAGVHTHTHTHYTHTRALAPPPPNPYHPTTPHTRLGRAHTDVHTNIRRHTHTYIHNTHTYTRARERTHSPECVNMGGMGGRGGRKTVTRVCVGGRVVREASNGTDRTRR